MVTFFQTVFFIAAIILIVMNVLEFKKWQSTNVEGSIKRYKIKWFNFVLTSLVAVGCLLNVLIGWINKV